ncbi:MAG: hypothetical protein LUJ09_08890 [Firmicutes bacterium]|nr:hypothetical protein [Bacillota bacterium]
MKKRMAVTIPRRGAAVTASWVLMAAAGLIRLGYYLPRQMDSFTFWVQLVMPVTAAVFYLSGIALGGKWGKGCVLAATALGVVFFMVKATTFTPLHQALCTLLYTAVLVLVFGTLLGFLPTKKLLYPLFSLPLAYHLLVEDTQAYFFAQPSVPVADWLPEISVLCIMAGLLCLSVSLKTEKLA